MRRAALLVAVIALVFAMGVQSQFVPPKPGGGATTNTFFTTITTNLTVLLQEFINNSTITNVTVLNSETVNNSFTIKGGGTVNLTNINVFNLTNLNGTPNEPVVTDSGNRLVSQSYATFTSLLSVATTTSFGTTEADGFTIAANSGVLSVIESGNTNNGVNLTNLSASSLAFGFVPIATLTNVWYYLTNTIPASQGTMLGYTGGAFQWMSTNFLSAIGQQLQTGNATALTNINGKALVSVIDQTNLPAPALTNLETFAVTLNTSLLVKSNLTVGSLMLSSNGWAGPTNTLSFTNTYWLARSGINTNLQISGFTDISNGVENAAMLLITNGCGSNITFFCPSLCNGTGDGSRNYVITNNSWFRCSITVLNGVGGYTNLVCRDLL